MRIRRLHSWDLPPRQAVALQRELAKKISLKKTAGKIRRVAGADIAILSDSGEGVAGVIVYSFPGLEVVEKRSARHRLSYPYIPGLLSFREGPVLLQAFELVRADPDVILFDGQGIAHPRALGIASHLGLFLDKPTIGCAKSLLAGEHRDPPQKGGAYAPLWIGSKRVGAALRTRAGVRPVFVSPGHMMSVAGALAVTAACCDGLRIPKPTREADRWVKELKRAAP